MQSEQQNSILQGHLPECPTAWMRDCICNELRMCEERVLRDMDSVYGQGFQDGREWMLAHFTDKPVTSPVDTESAKANEGTP